MTVNRRKLSKIIVAMFFTADFFQMFCLTTDLNYLNSIFKYFAAVLSILYYVYFSGKHLHVKKIIKQVLVGIGLLYTSLVTHNFSYFIIFCFILVSDGIDINDYIRYIIKCMICEIVICSSFWAVGQIAHIGIPFWFNPVEKRLSLGFTHANALAMKIIWCSLGWLFFFKWNKKSFQIICTIIINAIGFILTDSSAFVFSFAGIFFYLLIYNNKFRKIFKLLSMWVFPAAALFVYTISIFRNDTRSILGYISLIIDKFSNYRIAMSYLAIRDNGLTLLGQNITMEHSWGDVFMFGDYTIDTVYTYFFVSIGVVWLLLVFIGFFQVSRKTNSIVHLSIIIFSMCAMAELSVLYPTNCFVLILLGKFLVSWTSDIQDINLRGI